MRKTINLNEKWRFTDLAGIASEVDLPHTWNAIDGQDGGNYYHRGRCWYLRELTAEDAGAIHESP